MDKRCEGCGIGSFVWLDKNHNCHNCSLNPALQQQSNMDYVEVFQQSWYEHDKRNLEYGNALQNVNPHRKKWWTTRWKGECKLTREALHQMVAGGHIQ
jgi:hypothetical protein